ncbi:M1 family metallopeptidase [Phaeocystidibacter luteus]|uniref:M1 family metallopeptidase n=1 Tax=Phaeocystidibacter luteus TaxID=911197 RepID=A0A6N6RKN8_9FLAO|nr:M1 family metallopeptidase [Phaeocystidibacter luteus]KAB2808080.1 M1 family metallopeptidase [Phaeocystidibacter luteus]
MRRILLGIFALGSIGLFAQENTNQSLFRQLGQELPTPNVYRTGAGAPGHEYYQQKADYEMKIHLNDDEQRIDGEEEITYTNNSPDALEYLWLQLDQNMRSPSSMTRQIQKSKITENSTLDDVEDLFWEFPGGFHIEEVKRGGRDLSYSVVNTMMRINLDEPLESGESFTFSIKWWYNINDRQAIGGRSGYEYFAEEDNYIYTIAQFFPRMAVYNDVDGWQNKQFLGSGEFTLPFGDYTVELTVPADHVVGATGTLQNASSVLTSEQRSRLRDAAKNMEDPTMIINADEALENEGEKAEGEKTWIFKAENVRDFAFASSRKFIWDAMGVDINGRTVMAMSYYPKEGNPLWEQYSTRSVAHTLRVYSKYTIDYPYDKAISVHTDRIGMEYPMICFNGGRPEADGTYSEATKYGLISVIIHEVGHNFFPMIVNSDERQWTWMDEGLNTFVQYLAEQEWDREYPSRRGPAYKIVPYMADDKDRQMPIMTNSESIIQFGNNAYGKPATALNILRETVLGREQFDYAFKVYSERWAFKHPTPADFFRTMEDASATDLDWFWRGWFYTTNHVDIAMKQVEVFQLNTLDPMVESSLDSIRDRQERVHIGYTRNEEDIEQTVVETDEDARDFYNSYNPYQRERGYAEAYANYVANLSPRQQELLQAGYTFVQITFENEGGLIMPVILKVTFADGTNDIVRVPAEVWLKNEDEFTKVFPFEKEVVAIELDPFLETADTDRNDNYWPARAEPSRFQLFKRSERQSRPNPMQEEQQ